MDPVQLLEHDPFLSAIVGPGKPMLPSQWRKPGISFGGAAIVPVISVSSGRAASLVVSQANCLATP
jgi:hypothetical protein